MTIHLKMIKQIVAFCALSALSGFSYAAHTEVKSVRLWHAPDYTRLVFDLNGSVQHSLQQMDKPNRVVLDLKETNASNALKRKKITDSRVKSIRTAVQAAGGLRVVLDINANYRTQAFVLPPNGAYGHRLVVDLFDAELNADESNVDTVKAKTNKSEAPASSLVKTAAPEVASKELAAKPETVKSGAKKADAAKAIISAAENRVANNTAEKPIEAAKPSVIASSANIAGNGRPMIIAIDAGHGGDDPGAIGHKGTREKTITLAIARKLFARMVAEPGIKPIMTRSGDYFVPLDKRRQIARDKFKADLFVSIHADSYPAGRAFGASVYAISRKGATSAAAARLAESENRSDVVGGVSSAGKDDLLKSVLVDLSMDGTMEHSLRVGRNVLGELGSVGRLHRRNVEQAGFVVLKTADMPSILVETGFISTPEEEAKLTNAAYQDRLANAVTSGVRRYFASNPIPGSYFASLKKHPLHASSNTDSSNAHSGNKVKSDIVQIGRTPEAPNG